MDDNKIRTSDLRKLIEINNNENTNIKNIDTKNNENKAKQNKKLENTNKQKTSHRNTISSSHLTTNSNSKTHFTKALKKISTPSTASVTTGFCYNMNTEKSSTTNYQNIIIPKGNAVITINNNFYEHVSPSMKHSSNVKCKCKNTENKNILGKNNSNFIQISERKKIKDLKNFNSNTSIGSNKKSKQLIKFKSKKHNKQISQDFNTRHHHIHTESKSININDMENTEENNNNEINVEDNNNENGIQEKIIKFGSLSPQPMISNISDPTVFQTNESIENNNNNNYNNSKELNSKNICHNFYTEQNRNPNLITADTKGDNNEDEDDETKREKLLFHIRDIIEKEQQEKNKTPDVKHNSSIKQKKTISHFHPTSINKQIIEKIEYKHDKNPVLHKKTGKYTFVSSSLTGTNTENKNQKINYKISYNKINMPIKSHKANTKSILKSNFTKGFNKNSSLNTNSSKKKIFQSKHQPSKSNITELNNTNSLTNTKNNLIQSSEGLLMHKILSTNEKIINKTKLLNRRNLNDKLAKNNCKSKNNHNHLSHYSDKNYNTLSQSIIDKSPNSKLSKLLMSYNKNDINNSSGNILNDSRKKEIKNLKYNKNDFLINSNYHATYEANNNYPEHDNSKEIVKTEYKYTNSMKKTSAGNLYNSINDFDNKVNSYDNNSKKTDNCNSTYEKGKSGADLRNKYKSFITKKKNKQNSCDFNSQAVNNKINKNY